MGTRTSWRRHRFGITQRALALAMALSAFVSIRPASASPGDIFTVAAPAVGAEPPKAADLADGDASVSTQTGALTYSYPIAVPPGRNGMQPHIALSYSSQGAIYGGIAAGWSLAGLPIITEDTTKGRLGQSEVAYVTSLGGGRPLVSVTEPVPPGEIAYRAQNDATFTRYRRAQDSSGPRWTAESPDGTVYEFGDVGHTSNCTIISAGYAPITRMHDGFGNAVDYYYEAGVDSAECRIRSIEWGQNSAAGVSFFAAIAFDYAADTPVCSAVPVGSQTSYRTGVKIVTGASQLRQIRAAAFPPGAGGPVTDPIPTTPDHLRTTTLTYSDESRDCVAKHAAYRSLTSIQEIAVGADSPQVTLPPVTFTYGNATPAYPFIDVSPGQAYVHPGWFDRLGAAHNLGWGFRFSNGKWPTVEAMMLDVDGDGLLDRLTNDPYYSQDGLAQCRARWQRNLGNGNYDTARDIWMPTIKWATAIGAPDPYVGGTHAGANPTTGSNEGCALNYQQSGYVNSNKGVFGCLHDANTNCPASGHCADGSDCPSPSTQPQTTILAFRWFDIDGDGKPDLVASPADGGLARYNFEQGNLPDAPVEPPLFARFPWVSNSNDPLTAPFKCPSQPYADQTNVHPYTMCGGMFPWFVYYNHGNGQFGIANPGHPPLPDKILYQPVPLESENADSSITSLAVGQVQGTIDLNGDGFPDGIHSASGKWNVFPSDGVSGQLLPYPQTTSPFTFGTGSIGHDDSLNRTDYPGDSVTPVGIQGLFDANGDGLLDHWWTGTCDDCIANVEYNDGVQFRLVGGTGELDTFRPGTHAFTHIDWAQSNPPFLFEAYRLDSSRVLDVDSDGRADLSKFSALKSPEVYFNEGGPFGADVGPVGLRSALQHEIVVSDWLGYYGPTEPAGEHYTWEIRSDVIDLDGDGIPEGVEFGLDTNINHNNMWISKIPTPQHPPRLLWQIDNGRGLHTDVSYAPMSNSAAVHQDPSLGKTMPHTQWVVQSVTATDALGGTSSTTGYDYTDPEFTKDDRGKYAFRGFDLVKTTTPSGSRHDDFYDYGVDWTGRLSKTVVHPAEAITEARTIDTTTWEPRQLFGGALTTYHATVQHHFICSNGQTEADCTRAPAAQTVTTTTLQPLPQGAPVLFTEAESLLQAGTSDQDGDRLTKITPSLLDTQAAYRLRTLSSEKLERRSGAFQTFAKTAHQWDADLLVPLTDEVWVDSNDADRAVTRRDYDLQTGNVTKRWKPVQNAAGLAHTEYTYDPRKLFVSHESNEIGLALDYVYEYGTGTKLDTIGPNVASCVTQGQNQCPQGSAPKEEHRIRVDGLGRMIERFETFSDDGWSYTPFKVELNSYVDVGTASVTHQSALDFNQATLAVTYTQDLSELDGHGRPMRKTQYTFGFAPTNAVTTFQYSNDGTLASATLPDPTANDASTVTYVYTYDSLGRPTSIRRPDADLLAEKSGVDIAYDGVQKSTTEYLGAAGGYGAQTNTWTDAYGRLVRVDEHASSLQWATTNYGYGPDDNVVRVEDAADGIVTTMTHDFAGRRTSITRGTRTWSYGYDANGNTVSEQTPCTDPVECGNATTTTAYDDLDRPLSKVIAPRTLGAPDLALFGIGTEVYTWDVGANHKGRLSSWETHAPGTTTFTENYTPGFNAQDQETLTLQQVNVAGLPPLSRNFLKYYYISGQVANVYYRDVVGSQNCQNGSFSQTTYDRRGMPYAVEWVNCLYESTTYGYLVNDRNVGGAVTRRYLIGGVPSSVPALEADFSYDKLGRVTSQHVKQGASLSTVVRQDLTYFGNDDLATMTHSLGDTAKAYSFQYDLRHQLAHVGVTQPGIPAVFSGGYAYTNGGRLTSAAEDAAALPGGDVITRDVAYHYDGTDPEELTSLTSVDPQKPFAAVYTYDEAGNQLTRCYGVVNFQGTCMGDSMEYLYDGKDQLRRATKRHDGVTQGSEEYWYGFGGQRNIVVKRDASGNKTELIWFIGDSEAHYNADGTPTKVYSHVRMGAAPVARLERSSDAASTVELQFHGLADNTIAAVDEATGTVNASFAYAPFGEVIEATDAGSSSGAGVAAHRRRLNDKFVDEVSDLSYYGARLYDKTSITWTQPDPLSLVSPDSTLAQPRRSGLYSSVLNNPLRYVDPDGRTPEGAANLGIALGVLVTATAIATYDYNSLKNHGITWGEQREIVQNDRPGRTTGVPLIGDAFGIADIIWDSTGASGAPPHDEQLDISTIAKTFGPHVPGGGSHLDGGQPTTRDEHVPFVDTPENRDRMLAGKAPIGKDGHSVELHHKDDGQIQPLTRTDHRLGENFKKNHQNTGKQPSEVDRDEFAKFRRAFWKGMVK